MESFAPEGTTSGIATSVIPKKRKSFLQTRIKTNIYFKKGCLFFPPDFFSLVSLAGVENIDDSKNPANQIQQIISIKYINAIFFFTRSYERSRYFSLNFREYTRFYSKSKCTIESKNIFSLDCIWILSEFQESVLL